MSMITVDEASCISCGNCVKSCTVKILKMEEGFPKEITDKGCISCGHCVAICPTGAFDHAYTPRKNQKTAKAFPKLSEEEAEQFLRSRRSIRNYKKDSVPREKLIKLLEVARQAPTASNSQNISYLVIDNKEIIDKSVEHVINWVETSALSKNPVLMNKVKDYKENGTDEILRGAPTIIVAMSDKTFQKGRENSIFALTYLELFAPSIGLGTCWAGFLEAFASTENSPIPQLFNIPDDKVITGIVMVGYPQFSYNMLTDKNPLVVSFL